MAARLPTPGGDDGTWGTVLNDFLTQSHNADGTLKTTAVTSTGVALDDLSNVDPAIGRAALGLGTAATANKVAAGSPGVLDATDPSTTNARTPTAHATSHAPGGTDDISASYIAQPAAAPTDGQLLAWSATLGTYTPVAPTGASELASAINTTGTYTGCSAAGGLGTVVPIPGTAISISNSNGRPVVLHYGANAIQTAVGDGDIYLSLYETTTTATGKHSAIIRLPNSINSATYVMTLINQFPIGAVSSTRTFDLRVVIFAPTANNPAASILNASNNPTFLRAVAG
jgi:hypothetical protein